MVISSAVIGFLLLLAALNRPDILHAILGSVFGQKEYHTYAVKFEEAIGLDNNAEVRYGGTKVGKVTNVGLDRAERRIVAVLRVESDVPVNLASRASLAQATLTSQPHIEISVGNREAELIYADDTVNASMTYEDIPVIETQASGIFAALANVADDVQDLIGVQSAAASGQQISTVVDIMDNLNVTLEDGQDFIVRMRNEDIGRILEENIDPILTHTEGMMASGEESAKLIQTWIEENDDRLTATAQSAQNVAADIEKLTAELETYKTNIDNILQNTDGLTEESRVLLERNAPVIEDMLADLRADKFYTPVIHCVFTVAVIKRSAHFINGGLLLLRAAFLFGQADEKVCVRTEFLDRHIANGEHA